MNTSIDSLTSESCYTLSKETHIRKFVAFIDKIDKKAGGCQPFVQIIFCTRIKVLEVFHQTRHTDHDHQKTIDLFLR